MNLAELAQLPWTFWLLPSAALLGGVHLVVTVYTIRSKTRVMLALIRSGTSHDDLNNRVDALNRLDSGVRQRPVASVKATSSDVR